MRILVGYVAGQSGPQEAAVYFHTDRVAWNQQQNATTGGVLMDAIDIVKGYHLGTIPVAGSGWDRVANHPAHPNATFLQVLLAEVVRLNDAAARAVLGV